MTNFEKIKSLDVVDMAWVLEGIHCEDISAPDPIDGECMCYGFSSLIRWLKQDYDEHDDVWANVEQTELEEAVLLLMKCVNWDDDPMQTGISGELGDKIKEFIARCGE